MPKKTVREFATELGFAEHGDLLAALREFINHCCLSLEVFAAVSDDEVVEIAAKFVKRHGYNYWSCDRLSPAYPRDTVFIKEQIQRVLLLLRQYCADKSRVTQPPSVSGFNPTWGDLTTPEEQHNSKNSPRQNRESDTAGKSASVPLGNMTMTTTVQAGPENLNEYSVVVAESRDDSFRSPSNHLRNLSSSRLRTLSSSPESSHSTTLPSCFITLHIGPALANLKMDSRSIPNGSVDPRKRKFDSSWNAAEARKQSHRGSSESSRNRAATTEPINPPTQDLSQPEVNPTCSPLTTEVPGSVLTFRDTSPQFPVSTNVSDLPPSQANIHNGGAIAYESSLSTLDLDKAAVPRLTFEHNLIDWSIGLDELQYFFFWFLDEFEMERIQLRKKAREAPCERDALSVQGSLEYLKRFDSKFVRELKMRGAVNQGGQL